MKLQVKAGVFLFFFLCMKAGFCVNAQEPVFEKEGEVYLIQSAQDMRTLALLVNGGEEVEPGIMAHDASYLLTRDIDLSLYCTGEEGWEPIGDRKTDDRYFNGTFDGGGHVVTGLYINRPKEDSQGLFGQSDIRRDNPDSVEYQSGQITVIKNLYVQDCDITGDYEVGGIMGSMRGMWLDRTDNLYIENCHVTGYAEVGGITGDGSCLTGCYTRADVTGYNRTGGLIGTICYSAPPEPEGSSLISTIQNCLMGGYRLKRAQEIEELEAVHHRDHDHNGYIYGDSHRLDESSRITSPFYYREGLVTEGFGKGMYEFLAWNCAPYDCTHLEETDFKDLIKRPEDEFGQIAGANIRGFFDFQCVQYKGKMH